MKLSLIERQLFFRKKRPATREGRRLCKGDVGGDETPTATSSRIFLRPIPSKWGKKAVCNYVNEGRLKKFRTIE